MKPLRFDRMHIARTPYGKVRTRLAMVLAALALPVCAAAAPAVAPAPLTIREQGSFAVGGTVIKNAGTFDALKPSPAGQTFHGDHAYVSYQAPVHPRRLPLVLWHGAGQSSKTWETTPDDREGYQNVFLRRRFAVYLIDQPRRGKAGPSTAPLALAPAADEQQWFSQFRLGVWPDFFLGVRFSRDPQALEQHFRRMEPNTGPVDVEVISDAAAALFRKIGAGALVTPSQSGGPGRATAMKTPGVRAVVALKRKGLD